MLTLAKLQAAMPLAGATRAALFLPHLERACAEGGINTARRLDYFLATIAHESSDLNQLEENLNYSAAALCKTWPGRFPSLDAALPYGRSPYKIACRVYANRGGNGDEASGDGWTYRGAGLIQLTFKNNHAACAAHFGIALEKVGNWLRSPEGAARSAAWFWQTHGCNERADAADFDGVCDIVNLGHKTAAIGDAIGYASRLQALDRISHTA
jgi:putative chitinase